MNSRRLFSNPHASKLARRELNFSTPQCSGLLTEFINRGTTEMISPWGTRGKGIGLADRPVVPAVRRPSDRPHSASRLDDALDAAGRVRHPISPSDIGQRVTTVEALERHDIAP
jgi:hypothetical protein